MLLAAGVAASGLPGGLWPHLSGGGAAWARPPPPAPLPACTGPLDGPLAAALTRAVYSAVVQLQVMDEEDFQRENFKLREREYRYYAEANRRALPRVPNLEDNSGGLSNPAYYNFVSYCLWKVVYRHVAQPADREAFARQAAADFLARAPWGADAATGPYSGPPLDPHRVVRSVVLPFLEHLRAGGYLCRYQVVVGSHPGSWPQDWVVSQPGVMAADADGNPYPLPDGDALDTAGASGSDLAAASNWNSSSSGSGSGMRDAGWATSRASAEGTGGAGAGVGGGGGVEPPAEFLFQVKLHRPADILGSVALRSEEGGAWPRTVSTCLQLLLARQAGYGAGWDGAGPEGRGAPPPGEVAGSAAAEAAAAAAAGWAECDEFFYQDQWQGPSGLLDRVLLFFGDPLEQVGVDFVPTTLVQNWRLRRLG